MVGDRESFAFPHSIVKEYHILPDVVLPMSYHLTFLVVANSWSRCMFGCCSAAFKACHQVLLFRHTFLSCVCISSSFRLFVHLGTDQLLLFIYGRTSCSWTLNWEAPFTCSQLGLAYTHLVIACDCDIRITLNQYLTSTLSNSFFPCKRANPKGLGSSRISISRQIA